MLEIDIAKLNQLTEKIIGLAVNILIYFSESSR